MSLLLSGQTKCMKNIMKDLDHYAAAFQSYLKAPLRNTKQEVALLSPTVEMIQSLRKVRVLMFAWERVREKEWWFKTESDKTSWEITFWCRLTKAPSVSTELLPVGGRGGLLKGTVYSGFHSSGRRGVFIHWKRCCNPAVVSSRRMLPRCGAVTPSATGRRCARWWGASTPGPSPSTEPWATSPQESTGSDWRPSFDNLPWSSTTIT